MIWDTLGGVREFDLRRKNWVNGMADEVRRAWRDAASCYPWRRYLVCSYNLLHNERQKFHKFFAALLRPCPVHCASRDNYIVKQDISFLSEAHHAIRIRCAMRGNLSSYCDVLFCLVLQWHWHLYHISRFRTMWQVQYPSKWGHHIGTCIESHSCFPHGCQSYIIRHIDMSLTSSDRSCTLSLLEGQSTL